MPNTLGQIKSYIAPWQKKVDDLVSDLQKKFGKEYSLIGIDVGSGSVKAVQMKDVNGVMTIVKSAIVDIEGDPGDERSAEKGLRSAVAGMTVEGARVTAIINCPETCTRRIISPNMPKRELTDAVHWEAKNAIPYSIEEAEMDFKVLGEVMEKGVKKLAVAVAASPRETVKKIVSLCSAAGLELSALIPVAVGQQNMIASLPDLKKETVAVVEMGASITELNIYSKGKLDFSRKLPIAGNDITKAMTSALMSQQGKVELTIEEAEQIKKEKGIPRAEDADVVGGKILASQVLSLVRPCAEQLASEIERSFDFYREGAHGVQIAKIILFGGAANLKGLAEFLRGELNMEIIVGNALGGVKSLPEAVTGGDESGSRFNLAIGAALNKPGSINLLPVELKEKTRRFVENISLQAVAAGIAMTLLLVYIGLNVHLTAMNTKMDALKFEQGTLVPQLESVRSVIMAERTINEHPSWEDVLKELSNTIKPGIYLTEMEMHEDALIFKGIIIQDDRRAQSVLSEYMITLEEGIFRHVNLVTAKKKSENSSTSEFEITAEVD